MSNQLIRLTWNASTGHRGIGNLFKIFQGKGGKVRVGFVGPRANAPKKAGTDASINELKKSLGGISDKALRREMREGIKTESARRKAEAAKQTVAEVAAKHEFGLGVPQRSMIRAWSDRNQEMIRADIRKGIEIVAKGRLTVDGVLKVLGVKWVASLQEFIATPANFKPLSPVTIDIKGSSSPLIDTGQMRSSVTYELVKG